MRFESAKARVFTPAKNAPVFEESHGLARLVQVDDITNEKTWLRFRRRILWVRVIEATTLLMAGNKAVTDLGSYGDRPHGNALRSAVEAARSAVEGYVITPRSDLRCVVKARVKDSPCLRLEDGLEAYAERHAGGPEYFSLPEYSWVYDRPDQLEKVLAAQALPLDQRMDVEIPWVESRTVLPEQIVWSSARAQCLVGQEDEAWVARWVQALASREPNLEDLLLRQEVDGPADCFSRKLK